MEVEIKAKCENFAPIVAKLNTLGAHPVKIKRQIDQYYNHPQKDIRGTKEYIRLRSSGGKAVFAYHVNLNVESTKEYEVEVADFEQFQKILEFCGFVKLGLIDKNRQQFVIDEYIICLDAVAGIGNFIEIETEGNDENYKEKHKGCMELLTKLGLSKKDLSSVWLCDVATAKK